MIFKEDIDNLVIKIDEIAKFLLATSKEEAILREEQKKLESEQQDIVHDHEFSILSRTERNRLSKRLSEVRKERRYIKMVIELIEPCSNNSKLASNLVSIANKIRDIKELQSKRTYMPKTKNTIVNSNEHYEIKHTKDNKYKAVRVKNKT